MILYKIADFVTDTLAFNPEKVIIGRTNYQNVNFSDDIIIVDMLSSIPTGSVDKYDGVLETMSYSTMMKSVVTVTFYGTNAMDNASYFMILCKSERAVDSARINGIAYKLPSKITNVGRLMGTEQENKFEVELLINYAIEKTETILTIETAEITFLVNK